MGGRRKRKGRPATKVEAKEISVFLSHTRARADDFRMKLDPDLVRGGLSGTLMRVIVECESAVEKIEKEGLR